MANKSGKSHDFTFKLLLIGDKAVGKTSIMYRFSDDKFNPSWLATIGIDFKIRTIELNGNTIKLQIWDTAGQERFDTITAQYYRGAMGIMLVYDVTCQQSFDHIAKWLRRIEDHAAEDVVTMLVGNKCDADMRDRAVSKSRGSAMAAQHSISFIETSAKVGINVEKAFYDLATAILTMVPVDVDMNKNRVMVESLQRKHAVRAKCCR
uniref:Ras-related protein Rab-13 n=1 Tax=Plectus sambesii TaxID=2011161 RepID=A0A914VP31_9BILA